VVPKSLRHSSNALSWLAVAVFALVAAPARAQTVDLLLAGDIAECDLPGAAATAALLDDLPGRILALGDLAYPGGSARDFRKCYEPTWGRHKARTWPLPGNHDYGRARGADYHDYWGARAGERDKGYYAFDYGAWRIIMLNSNLGREARKEQQTWLARDLDATRARCVLAAWHHPLFSTGPHGYNSQMLPEYRLLEAGGASVVVAGHDHNYERFAPLNSKGDYSFADGLHNFVVGTGGGQLRQRPFRDPLSVIAKPRPGEMQSKFFQATTHGVLRLRLAAESFAWEFLPAPADTPLDTGEANCRRRPSAPPRGPN
jgi:acid phosphatase type 7